MPAITAFDVSIDLFLRGLRSLKGMLAKAYSHRTDATEVAAKVPENVTFNVQCCVNLAIGGLGLLTATQQESPVWSNDDKSLEKVIASVDQTIALLEGGAKPADLDDVEGRTLEVTYGNGQTAMWGGREYILGYGIPNFMFHLCMVYSNLQSHGVEVGKMDYLLPFMAGMAPNP
ncbi:hypothetical protein NKR19_g3040 [Coniochaeta hoffmannii]|uniref:DUF1993 domain-containing protein n=1 Tax=Coniochaeta hoffmannii TaxID=91930 RepID=A0AA38S9P8_9PEZI|nr:hypothetical protein NKR19_g3040 [Coniochaeta hoffmannii]